MKSRGRAGRLSARWRGGLCIAVHGRSGYRVWIWRSPLNPKKNIQVFEHRIVAMREIGRELRDFETVHHKNGIKTDNRAENLEVWTTPPHRGQRPGDLVGWVMENYEKEVRAKLEVKDLVRAVISRLSSSNERSSFKQGENV